MSEERTPYGELAFDRERVRRYASVANALLAGCVGLFIGVPFAVGALAEGEMLPLGLFAAAAFAAALSIGIVGPFLVAARLRRGGYDVDEDSLNLRGGALFRFERVIPLEGILSLVVESGPLMRCFGVWALVVQAADGSPHPRKLLFESRERAVEARERVMAARRIHLARRASGRDAAA